MDEVAPLANFPTIKTESFILLGPKTFSHQNPTRIPDPIQQPGGEIKKPAKKVAKRSGKRVDRGERKDIENQKKGCDVLKNQ